MKRPHFALPEIYDDSLSYYDVLRKLIKSMHVISDNLNKIPEQIANEKQSREQADGTLQTNIDNEAMARQEADNELRELISTSGGGVTEEQLNEEVTARQQADTALQTNIDNEKQSREQADQEIREVVSDKISELKSDLSDKVDFSKPQSLTSQQQTQAQSNIGIHKVTQANLLVEGGEKEVLENRPVVGAGVLLF